MSVDFIKDSNHQSELEKLILTSKKIIFCSGWVYNDGLKLLNKSLISALNNDTEILMYSSTQHTQVTMLKKLNKYKKFESITLKKEEGKVHTKLYYFEYKDSFTAIVGSANITNGGLKTNKELSIKIEDSIGSKNYHEIQRYLNSLCDLSK